MYVTVPKKSFLAENGINLRKVSFGMFSVYYICSALQPSMGFILLLSFPVSTDAPAKFEDDKCHDYSGRRNA